MIARNEPTILTTIERRAREAPQAIACYHADADRVWQPMERQALWDAVVVQAHRLQALGLRKGDRFGICAATSLRWQILELAVWAAGGVVVALDPYSCREALAHALSLTEPSMVFVDGPKQMERIQGLSLADMPRLLTEADCFNKPAPEPVAMTLPRVRPDDAAIIILTSGTTGDAKGIQYTHGQLMAGCNAIIQAFPGHGTDDATICWLPMAHLFQQVMNLVALKAGIRLFFVENPREIMDAVRTARPTFLIGVPRLYEKIHAGFQDRLRALPRTLRRLVMASLDRRTHPRISETAAGRTSVSDRLLDWVIDHTLLRALRRMMGGRIKFMITGSAPMPLHILEFFHGAGLLILEAYGVSENVIPIACNRVDDYRFGSVGKVLVENRVHLAGRGEVVVRGPGVAVGYYSQEGVRARAEGATYSTRDCGYFDDDGFLYLRGRLSDTIKTSTGRRIAPARIEALLTQSPLIGQTLVTGHGRPHLVALVVPENQACSHAEMERELARINQELPYYEQVRAFALLPQPFSVSAGEMTTSLKIRRAAVEGKYRRNIDRLYREASEPVATERHQSIGVGFGSSISTTRAGMYPSRAPRA